MTTKIEWTPDDIDPAALAWVGIAVALIAGLGTLVLQGGWFVVAVYLLGFSVVLGIVGAWAFTKMRRGQVERPTE